MKSTPDRGRAIRLFRRAPLVAVALTALILGPASPPIDVSAHIGGTFGPACGAATIDGVVNAAEWSGAATRTFAMPSSGSTPPFTVTLHVMNDGQFLYMGITINDDEFTSHAQYLPKGDGFRIDFDNDHSGSLFALGDDVLSVSAGAPQFEDGSIYAGTSARSDELGGGTVDGSGAASRVGSLNHFELKHPLCSGDALDFCLHAKDTVGFRLEYLDAQADGSFGGSQWFPGSGATSQADIVISTCSAFEWATFLPLIRR
mgnify:CR=1 FL=1